MHSLDYTPPEDNGLDILYIDDDLLVLNKPSGLLSVPGRGEDKQDCLASRAQARYPEALIVHRLDQATSGVMLMARGPDRQRTLSLAFQTRETEKRYLALVAGDSAESGEIDLPLICDWPNRPRQKVDLDIGKPSLTRYRRLDYDAGTNTSRVELTPITGRSHQLRVHLSAIGHPILGDPLYAPPAVHDQASRLMLHAWRLTFQHPTRHRPVSVEAKPVF